MKSFRKLLSICAFGSVFAFSTNIAGALTIVDVPQGYWAERAIVQSISNNFINVYGNEFRPEDAISRAEFANTVYNVIQRGPVPGDLSFNDVTYQSEYGRNILTLQQLGIVFGYPDGNFKPEAPMKRSEASSVIANILKSEFWDGSVLKRFRDNGDVPSWAADSYISNIINNVYVNYPDEDTLRPNEYLTRAQAAVLAVKLYQALDSYKTSYLPEPEVDAEALAAAQKEERIVPILVGKNTLGEFQPSYKNTVDLYDTRKIIEAGNLVPVRAAQKVNAKTVSEGETLVYVSPKDVYSLEGTKLYSEGTKFVGYVDKVEKSYWRKKQHKAYIVFNKAILNDGTEFPIAGVLYSTYKGNVVLEKEKDTRKIQQDAVKKYPQRDAAIKFTEKLVPVIKYEEKAKDNLFMLITGDMIIPENTL